MSNNLMVVKPAEVTSLSERIRTLMPGGGKLTAIEAQSLAQVALLHGLDPFNGECWFLKDKSGNPIGIMAGIKGHRRAAHRQLDSEGGGNFWCEFDQLTPEEKKALAMPDNALAFRCRLYDSISLRLYTEQIERLCKAGVPWESVKDIVGDRPITVGYGFFVPGEPTRMKPAACGMKRAEADALKRRFDLPFGSAVGAAQDAGDDATEGEYTVTTPEPEPEPEPEPGKQPPAGNVRTLGSRALYGDADDSLVQPEPADTLSPHSIRAKVGMLVGARDGQAANARQVGLAQGMLVACFNTDDQGQREEMRHRVLRYLFGVAHTSELQAQHHLALLDWLKPARNEAGKYQPGEAGAKEARAVERAALLDEEQSEFEFAVVDDGADPLVAAAVALGGHVLEA